MKEIMNNVGQLVVHQFVLIYIAQSSTITSQYSCSISITTTWYSAEFSSSGDMKEVLSHVFDPFKSNYLPSLRNLA